MVELLVFFSGIDLRVIFLTLSLLKFSEVILLNNFIILSGLPAFATSINVLFGMSACRQLCLQIQGNRVKLMVSAMVDRALPITFGKLLMV